MFSLTSAAIFLALAFLVAPTIIGLLIAIIVIIANGNVRGKKLALKLAPLFMIPFVIGGTIAHCAILENSEDACIKHLPNSQKKTLNVESFLNYNGEDTNASRSSFRYSKNEVNKHGSYLSIDDKTFDYLKSVDFKSAKLDSSKATSNERSLSFDYLHDEDFVYGLKLHGNGYAILCRYKTIPHMSYLVQSYERAYKFDKAVFNDLFNAVESEWENVNTNNL